MDEIVKDFLVESRENLDRLDQELVRLESDSSSRELLDGIFRTIHTIKGSCGFLGFHRLEKVAHVGENLLSRLREGKLSLNATITSGLLAMVDAIRRMLNDIQTTETDGDNDYADLLVQLKALHDQENGQGNPVAPASAAIATSEPSLPADPLILQGPAEASPASPAPAPPDSQSASATSTAPQFRPSPSKIGGLLVNRGAVAAQDLALALQEQERGDRRRLGEILVALGFCHVEDINAAQQILEARGRNTPTETVRVNVDLLDSLMNLVGELVLVRNQLLQASQSVQDTHFRAISQRMSLIVSEVQEHVVKTRMQPIANVWNKFPRTVRDLALSCGKEVQLEMVGQDTELDRTIIESIKDPLTHLLRNCIDHGIEMPAARQQAGKDPAGHVTLRAFHEGGRVNLEIQDDGAGLNVERIRRKAEERGLITAQQAQRMSEREIFNLIFLPGFSTAEKVTNVSGRGVGMDVVKTNVEKINGAIDLQSEAGKGMTVRISLPLTLAIIPALLVSCRGERFAVPQVSVLELVGLESAASGHGIEVVHGAPVYRLRGKLLPLVYLDRQLKLPPPPEASGPPPSIVVLHAEGRLFGVVVDDILDTEEIVVKPLIGLLRSLSVYSGATIMGDGRVALILDVLGLAQHSGIVTEAQQQEPDKSLDAASAEAHLDVQPAQSLLIARNGSGGQVAIPLSTVARLEGFKASQIQTIGAQEVLEYRGKIIPLVRLSHILPSAGSSGTVSPGGSIEVVVHSERGRTVGLIVDCIVDIIDERVALDPLTLRPGVVGSFVADNCITEMLDLPGILQSAVPGLIEQSDAAAAGG